VISAMSLLEARLREHLDKSPWPQVRNPMSMQSLVKIAREQQTPDRSQRIETRWVDAHPERDSSFVKRRFARTGYRNRQWRARAAHSAIADLSVHIRPKRPRT
jgi:hypothetical protein